MPGWLNLIDELCCTLQIYLDSHSDVPQVKVLQVKEKFGGLRFYFSGGDKACRGGTPFDGKTVVITHHAPALDYLSDDHAGHLAAAYANDWSDLLGKADLWVYGHTHVAASFIKNGCRVVSNPRGYPGQHTGFDPGLIIEL